MNATAAVVPSEGSILLIDEDLGAPCISDAEVLMAHFAEAERAASEAYRSAFQLDVAHEQLKKQLTALVQEFGVLSSDGSKRTLRLRNFVLTLTAAKTSRVDHTAVKRFRYAMIQDGCGAHGLAAEIFEGELVYMFRPCASTILAGMKLSGELRDLLDKCEIVSEVPILDVSRIATE